ncbi:MAG: endolytic transglycosylase MltG, partial [Actinomycetota bacterium]
AEKTSISEAAYLNATKVNGRQLPLGGAAGAANLEGFLFPSTYDLDPGIDAVMLVDRQLDRFNTQTASVEWGKAGRLGLNAYQVLIVASLIEREAKIADERALIAAVMYNRLSAGMKLEVDATVQYALGYWKPELTQDDLDIDSPFNTRLYKGLPPGPICNPGLDSINAALKPEQVDYLYFVATGDKEGSHFFTSSYDDFLRAKEESGTGGR